jgi:lipid A ethanolaminephosphotransferase
VLLYVSDHGESLGENGLYLHGQPFVIAPAVQKHVPMLMWFSREALPRLRLDGSCIRTRLATAASHDNLSHTLLGLADVATSARREELDSLHPCRL